MVNWTEKLPKNVFLRSRPRALESGEAGERKMRLRVSADGIVGSDDAGR